MKKEQNEMSESHKTDPDLGGKKKKEEKEKCKADIWG